jgi:hypothetical protein
MPGDPNAPMLLQILVFLIGLAIALTPIVGGFLAIRYALRQIAKAYREQKIANLRQQGKSETDIDRIMNGPPFYARHPWLIGLFVLVVVTCAVPIASPFLILIYLARIGYQARLAKELSEGDRASLRSETSTGDHNPDR